MKKTNEKTVPARGRGAAIKGYFLNRSGQLRRGFKLVFALSAVLLAAWAVPTAMTALFGRLFEVWGVTSESAARAPGWAQLLYGGFSYVSGFAQGAAIFLAARLMGRALGARVEMGKGFHLGIVAGAGTAFGLLALLRLLDVMRFGHALTRPALSALTPMLMTFLVAQALGAAMATGLIGEILSGWHKAFAYAGSALLYALLFGRWTPIGLLSGALFGLLLWLMREKKGGIAPAFGFLSAFSLLTVGVFGMPPWSQGALYETYHVSKPWLTGGGAGPWAGLLLPMILLSFIAALALPNRRTKAAPLPRPARPGRAERN